ncbi:MAG: hydroxyethylthiazole kinase [Xanthobacteraceae bacterium]|nr:MAG: hydroxyethylthiazole kinase [Xanthobacteraceae bacterium]
MQVTPVSSTIAVLDADARAAAARLVERLRARVPRVHCITNSVAQAFTANVLLAAGVVPSMTIAAAEVGAMVGSADALLINLGTLDAERRAAAEVAPAAAKALARPWALDPVKVDRSPPRLAFAQGLLERGPALVRLNAGEFAALAGAAASRVEVAAAARRWRCVVALTGEADIVSDGTRTLTLHNGDALMTRVTAMGCAETALAAAALAVEPDPWLAATAALIVFGVAGERAARSSHGPGSFAVTFLDELHNLTPELIGAEARVTP